MLAVALGRAPFAAAAANSADDGFWSLLHDIRDAPPPELPAGTAWSAEIRAFLARCLEKDAKTRPTAADLLDLPFLRGAAPGGGAARGPGAAAAASGPRRAALRARDAAVLDATLDAVRAHVDERLRATRPRGPAAAGRGKPPEAALVAAAATLLDGRDADRRFAALADQLDMDEADVEAAVRARLAPPPPDAAPPPPAVAPPPPA